MSTTIGLTFVVVKGGDVTDSQLQACATLFNANYGVWGERAVEVSSYLTPGTHVKMSAKKLRAQCVGDAKNSNLALCFSGNTLVGHAFATHWDYGQCTSSLLVVSADHRRKGIATYLIRSLRGGGGFNVFGLVSSHPAACIALSAVGASHWITTIDIPFIRENAASILETTPVEYLRTAKLVGTAFDKESTSLNTVSSALTNFFVDHEEPLRALTEFREKYGRDAWPLGDLLDGHEYMIIVQGC
ncbi:hypothetical protein CPB85DRAFT_1487079 [Mucidula mucida]|nr:hypothetical protein CPB85DRAFT_1487079 [Mucidula mucida]